MSKKRNIPFWLVSAICTVVAVAAAFVYFENFLPWPNGTPPNIAGKWKLVTTSTQPKYTPEFWKMIDASTTTFDVVRVSE